MKFLGTFGKIVCWPPPPSWGLALQPRGNPGSATVLDSNLIYFLPVVNQLILLKEQQLISAVADLHRKILDVCPLPLPPFNCLHFHAVSGKIWPNNRLAKYHFANSIVFFIRNRSCFERGGFGQKSQASLWLDGCQAETSQDGMGRRSPRQKVNISLRDCL